MRRGRDGKPFYARWWVWVLVIAVCWTIGFTLGRFGPDLAEQPEPTSRLTIREIAEESPPTPTTVPTVTPKPTNIPSPLPTLPPLPKR